MQIPPELCYDKKYHDRKCRQCFVTTYVIQREYLTRSRRCQSLRTDAYNILLTGVGHFSGWRIESDN